MDKLDEKLGLEADAEIDEAMTGQGSPESHVYLKDKGFKKYLGTKLALFKLVKELERRLKECNEDKKDPDKLP